MSAWVIAASCLTSGNYPALGRGVSIKLRQNRGFLFCGSAGGGALSITFAIHFNDRRVVDQAVDSRRCHGGVREDIAPSGKCLIGGDGDAVSFVSMRDEFEQDAGLGLILADMEARFDVLIACAFNFDAHASELSKLGLAGDLKGE